MRVQVIPSPKQKFLKEFYGCSLWKIFTVIKVNHCKSHHNCKVQKTWKTYTIKTKHTYPHNHFGQETEIRLGEDECLVLEENPESGKKNLVFTEISYI